MVSTFQCNVDASEADFDADLRVDFFPQTRPVLSDAFDLRHFPFLTKIHHWKRKDPLIKQILLLLIIDYNDDYDEYKSALW